MYAKVIVDIAHSSVDKMFDYSIPTGMNIFLGMRVIVPFGRNKIEGFVVGFSNETSVEKNRIKPVLQAPDNYSVLNEEQIQTAYNISKKYNSTLSQALKLMVPQQLRINKDKVQKTAKICVFDEDYKLALRSLLKPDGTPKFERQVEVLERLHTENDGVFVSKLNISAVNSLEKKGFIKTSFEQVMRKPFKKDVPLLADFELSNEQKAAVFEILNSNNKHILLHGVTGSGKTEVYINVIKDCIRRGKTAILLVPEISLTPQTYIFLKRRFSEKIAVFHSGLSAGERYDEWKRVKSGEVSIVLGARSAVFAPLENIGAIIIDEQHEGTYQAENHPKYKTSEVAKMRCDYWGGILLMGSATPDIETYYAAKKGQYKLVCLKNRLFGLQLPQVKIIDMRKELQAGNRSVLSGSLYHSIKDALVTGKQVMLFLNRRGYSTFAMCRACGQTVMCDSCDVSMTYHKPEDILKCHYCGKTTPVSKQCSVCKKPYVKFFGAGTQQIEEQIKSYFKDARVIRMDFDTMSTKDSYLNAFNSFAQKEADVLIGTQMITKGFDFEDVTVAAVIAADTMLYIPDYRSAERTFCQITQVAGRAGRKQEGNVILQTYCPTHYAVTFAAKHDYEGFYAHEIKKRRAENLPPFASFIQIQFFGKNESEVVFALKDFKTKLNTVLLSYKDDIISIKQAECAIKKIKDIQRYHILIHAKNIDNGILKSVYDLSSQTKYKNVLTGVDLNPMNMT